PYDHADITAALANRVCLEALSASARRRQDARDGSTWDPARPLLHGRIPHGRLGGPGSGAERHTHHHPAGPGHDPSTDLAPEEH
ncbi:MAG TPA: hypothetical protein VHM65_01530, partial [Candidatus Lustribacter sp.]|nr:hypothetical protein [Candidatus Lustribacter sp.]